MIKVAVLLTTFNGQRWLKEQLDSILCQNNIDLDIYISDDHSTDRSQEIIYGYLKKHSNIIVLENKIKYGNAAQNFFRLIRDVTLTKYDFVAFSDQDDIWLPDKLHLAVNALNYKNVDGYSSNVTAFWPDGKQKLISKAQPQTRYDYMFESAGPGCSFVLTEKLAASLQKTLKTKKDNLQNIALHDWFIYAFARSKGFNWHIDSTPTLLYRQHADNVVGANTGIRAIKARLSKLRQGWYTEQILLIARNLNYKEASPIQKILNLNSLNRCYLAIFAHHFRRRLRDRFAFALFILFLAKQS